MSIALLGRPEPSLQHARRCLELCEANALKDFDLAFAYEAVARAEAVAGRPEDARAATERALAAVAGIAEEEDRAVVLADLETIPKQTRFW